MPRLRPSHAEARIERQLASDFPIVLPEPLDRRRAFIERWAIARFCVALEIPEKRVCERMVGVVRIVGIGAEINRAVKVSLFAFDGLPALEIEARLHAVHAMRVS